MADIVDYPIMTDQELPGYKTVPMRKCTICVIRSAKHQKVWISPYNYLLSDEEKKVVVETYTQFGHHGIEFLELPYLAEDSKREGRVQTGLMTEIGNITLTTEE